MGIQGWSFVGMVEVCGATGGGGGVDLCCFLLAVLTRFVRRCVSLYCCRSPYYIHIWRCCLALFAVCYFLFLVLIIFVFGF